MSRIRDEIKIIQQNEQAGSNSIENSLLKTTTKLLIEDNRALLPSKAVGDLVFNMAIVFDNDNTDMIVAEVTVTTDGTYVIFDQEYDMNGKYCVVTYLTEKV